MRLSYRATRLSLIALVCALGGCGGGDTTEYGTSPSAEVVKSVAGAATGRTISVSDMPPFATLYADARVISNMRTKSEDQLSGMVNYSTKATVPQLVDFYKKSLAANGMEIGSEADSGGSYVLSAANKEKGQQLHVTILPNQEDDQRVVALVHSIPNPEKPADGE